jgi:hypothetical protein
MLFTQQQQTAILTIQRMLITALVSWMIESVLSGYRDLEVLNTVRTGLLTKRHGIIRIFKRSKSMAMAVFIAAVVTTGLNAYPTVMTRIFPVEIKIAEEYAGTLNAQAAVNTLTGVTLDVGEPDVLSFISNDDIYSYLDSVHDNSIPVIDLSVAANWSYPDNNVASTQIRKSGLIGNIDSTMVQNYTYSQEENYITIEASAGIEVPELNNLADQYLLRLAADTYLNDTSPFTESLKGPVVPSVTIGHDTHSRYAYAGFYFDDNIKMWQEVTSIYWDAPFPVDCSREVLYAKEYPANFTAVCTYASQVSQTSGSSIKVIVLEEQGGWVVILAAASSIVNGQSKLRFLALKKRISLAYPNTLGPRMPDWVPLTGEIHSKNADIVITKHGADPSVSARFARRPLLRQNGPDLNLRQLAYIKLYLVLQTGFLGVSGVQTAKVYDAADMNLFMVLFLFLFPAVCIIIKLLINQMRPYSVMAFGSNSIWDMVLSSTLTEQASCYKPITSQVDAFVVTTGYGLHTLLEINGKSLVRLHIDNDKEPLFSEDTKGRFLYTNFDNQYVSKALNHIAKQCSAHTGVDLTTVRSDRFLQDSANAMSIYARPLACIAAFAYLAVNGETHIELTQLGMVENMYCNVRLDMAAADLQHILPIDSHHLLTQDHMHLTVSQALQLCGTSKKMYEEVCEILQLANYLQKKDPVAGREALVKWLSYKLLTNKEVDVENRGHYTFQTSAAIHKSNLMNIKVQDHRGKRSFKKMRNGKFGRNIKIRKIWQLPHDERQV